MTNIKNQIIKTVQLYILIGLGLTISHAQEKDNSIQIPAPEDINYTRKKNNDFWNSGRS